MKKIKYRTWNKEEGRWATHNEQLSEVSVSASVLSPSILTVGEDKYELQMFTGLFDQNGEEIYIGDIVDIEVETTEGFYRTDRYEVIINDFMQIPVIDSERGQDKLYNCHKFCKVVGNVYDMPDWEF